MAFKHVSLYLTLLVSVQVCLAGPTTTPAPFAFPTFAEVVANAQKSISDATSHIQQMLGMPEVKNVDQIVAVVKNASVDFTKKVNDVLTTVKTEALTPTFTRSESLFRNLSQSMMDIKKDLSKYNATVGAELLLATVDGYVAKIQEQLEYEKQILGRIELKQFRNMLINTTANLVQQGVKAYDEFRKKVDPNAKAAAAAFQKFYSEVNKTATELAKKVPELQSTDVEKVFTKSLSSIVEEGNKLRAALEKEAPHAQESLTKAAQNIIDSAVKAANSFAGEQFYKILYPDKQ
uniref:SP33.23 n=1 Tax=Bemisia tabaci TaxID=7038 RepID=A0A7S5HGA9_BEMTA|nr:SP33.23 [Bemisia tabaci]